MNLCGYVCRAMRAAWLGQGARSLSALPVHLRPHIIYSLPQALKRFALFSQSQKFEDAVEAYTKAGNCFKARAKSFAWTVEDRKGAGRVQSPNANPRLTLTLPPPLQTH